MKSNKKKKGKEIPELKNEREQQRNLVIEKMIAHIEFDDNELKSYIVTLLKLMYDKL